MPTSNVYKVIYHFEKNGKRVSDTAQDFVIAADANSLSSVLSSNNKTNNGVGTLVIESYSHVSGTHLS